MAEAVTTIDRAGRVVIPKEIRERMNLEENSVLLLAETNKEDALILKKLDIREIADRLRGELKGKEVDEIARKVEKESNDEARKELRRRNIKLRH
jgi:AbrB family looped-hinge helix DNA binding protein